MGYKQSVVTKLDQTESGEEGKEGGSGVEKFGKKYMPLQLSRVTQQDHPPPLKTV